MNRINTRVYKPDAFKKSVGTAGKGTFSLVSYNLLCDTFATPDRFPDASLNSLEWSHRWRCQLKELELLDGDIACFQEVTIARWEEMQRAMRENLQYDAIVQLKPHEVKLATCWRSSKFDLVWWEERSRAILAELRMRSDEQRDGDMDTGTSEEDERFSGPSIYIVNVHLEASPYKTADKVHQLKHALSRLSNHISKTGYCDPENAAVVVAGDFNSTAEEPACMLLRDGSLTEELWESIHNNGEVSQPSTPTSQISNSNVAATHPFRLKDVYSVAPFEPPYTRKLYGEEGAQLDFIWATEDNFDVVGVLDALYEKDKELIEREGLPNEIHCSDHIPVGAIMRLRQ